MQFLVTSKAKWTQTSQQKLQLFPLVINGHFNSDNLTHELNSTNLMK